MRKVLVLALVLVLSLTACAFAGELSEGAKIKPVVKIGIRADMVNQMGSAKAEIEKLGYKVETFVFDDSVQPDVALAEKSIDMNWYQHEPYMNNFNRDKGTDFVMIQPKTFYPLFAMFSSKWDRVDQLPDGAVIGLCNDATNQARGLKMLQSQNLIKLDPEADVPTIFDVKENPKKIKFITAEMSVLPQSLQDVDGICLAAGHMVHAGLSAEKFVCQTNDNEEYAVGFAVRGEDKDAVWAKEIAKAVQCDALAEYFMVEKQGTQLPLWK
ncbi:MAG: hypothetical protein IJ520_02890 [Synergistaceae bacterium]|nr:hypothetical protein [Synergistaceae bacterium]